MGTTSEKLSYLNTTKTKIKESLNLGGANLTNETFREYADEIKDRYLYFMNNGLDVVWDNWDKVTGTGTTLTLNNTEEAPMKLEYKGNTSQNGTPTPSSPIPVQVVSGDNSINISNEDNTQSVSYPISLSSKNLARFPANCPLPIPQAWTIIDFGEDRTFDNITTTFFLEKAIYTNGNAAVINYQKNDGTNQYRVCGNYDIPANTETTGKYSRTETNFTFRKVTVLPQPTFTQGTMSIQIEKGSTATELSTYFTPIELCKIGTYQDKIDKSTGKNLFDTTYQTDTQYSTNGSATSSKVYILNNDTITISTNVANSGRIFLNKTTLKPSLYTISFRASLSGTDNTLRYSVRDMVSLADVVSATSLTITNGNKYSFSFSLTGTTDRTIAISLQPFTANGGTLTLSEIQLEKGTSSSDYEPYGKVWYKYSAIGKVVLDGSETNWYITATHRFYTNINDLKTALGGEGLCNSYVRKTTLANENGIVFGWNNQYIYIYNSSYDDVSNWRTNLASNNVTAYYILATPTYTEITDTNLINQLEAIKKSVEGQTNISQVNDGLPFELDVSALGKMS